MNIKAKLFVCGEERELISTSLNYIRLTDWNGKPTSALMGGAFTVTFKPEMYDDTFIEWIIADRKDNKKIRHPFNLYLLRDGKVVFYEDDFDGVELFQYNFQDGVLINYHEVFDNQNGMYVTLTISPAMQDYRFFNNSTDWRRKSRTRYIKPWQESFIRPIEDTPYKAKENKNNAIASSDKDSSEQQIMRPEKISFSKSKEEVLSSYIAWYHFIDKTTESDRGKLILDDIVNYTKSKRKKGMAEKWFGMGSMTTNVVKKYYRDAGGSMVMTFDEGLKGKSGELYEISIVSSMDSGKNAKNEVIYFYSIKLKGGGNAMTMRITGTDLFSRVYQAVQRGGFFEKKVREK
ncbi:type VI secretion system tube protein TssD [Tenacibaculum sp. SSH1-16]|uniref:type VI secretion system tube protein TssD n=2 Tax=Tenacibaculum TaxID=104267 RepID=UPI0032C4480C